MSTPTQSFANSQGQRKLDSYWQALQGDPRLVLHATTYAWAAGLFEPGWVLDVGCEFGFGSALLVQANPSLRVLGCDVDIQALGFARGIGEDSGTVVCQAAADALPFARDDLSGVCLFNILHLVREPHTIVREARRVLKDGQRLVITLPRDDNLPVDWRAGQLDERLSDLAGRLFEEIHFPEAVAAPSVSPSMKEQQLGADAPILVAVCR